MWTNEVNQSTFIPENLYHTCRMSYAGAVENILHLSFRLPHE